MVPLARPLTVHDTTMDAASTKPPKMPTVGLLTGLSWVSGRDYYCGINEQTSALAPRGTSMARNPPMVIVSLDCDEYVTYLENRDEAGVCEYLFSGVQTLFDAKVDLLVIASNTAHCVVPTVRSRLPSLPILHIADTTAAAAKLQGMSTVGLVGTEPTMRDGSWLKSRLEMHGLKVLTPTEPAILRRCYDIICQELSVDVFTDESRVFFVDLVQQLAGVGCEGVILGCTEIELLVPTETVTAVPLLRSAAEHIQAASRVLAGVATLEEFEPADQEASQDAVAVAAPPAPDPELLCMPVECGHAGMCACVPKGISPSLFEMAKRRKAAKEAKLAAEQANK